MAKNKTQTEWNRRVLDRNFSTNPLADIYQNESEKSVKFSLANFSRRKEAIETIAPIPLGKINNEWTISLEPEPSNTFDSNATKIMIKKDDLVSRNPTELGYVPAKISREIKRAFLSNRIASIQITNINQRGQYKIIRLKINFSDKPVTKSVKAEVVQLSRAERRFAEI